MVKVPLPITNAAHHWKTVPRLYLKITDEDGCTGIGEASPLPGYSPDTAALCHGALSELLPRIMNRQVLGISDIESTCALVPKDAPAARFALETALLDLFAQSKNAPLWSLFVNSETPIEVNGLLSDNETEATAQNLFDTGIRVFKMKIGTPNQFPKELDSLVRLRKTFGNEIAIRLDANSTLAGPDLLQKLNRLSAFDPEYIEEPFPLSQQLPDHLPVPFAVDESLVEINDHQKIAVHPQCRAFVLKPTLLGGFFNVLKLARIANQCSCEAVVTHCHESLPGFLATIHLSIAVKSRTACGLYPHAALRTSASENYFRLTNGRISLISQMGLGILPNDIQLFTAGGS
ncbi:MAG: hypothetical protein JXX14_13515 [Deltaproteobacteria bacterium]|nr:hypothetical protein [Deltaproteobacteria bacterium]